MTTLHNDTPQSPPFFVSRRARISTIAVLTKTFHRLQQQYPEVGSSEMPALIRRFEALLVEQSVASDAKEGFYRYRQFLRGTEQ